MFNIFQDNDLIRNAIAKALGYDVKQEYNWFTKDIYFQTFFYLSKRFGTPSMFDNCKEAGAWSFKVKEFIIEVRMNSSWVEFMMYGKISNRTINSPYVVKLNRERNKKSELIINEYGEWSEYDKRIADSLFEIFLAENNINKSSLTQKQFDRDFGMKWYNRICKYNSSVVNVDYEIITKLYGETYQNSYTRHAIRTLNQFLNNMLTPIWIRDVPYNIKGLISDENVDNCKRFENNIKIEFISHMK
jgi:hypothetical protein